MDLNFDARAATLPGPGAELLMVCLALLLGACAQTSERELAPVAMPPPPVVKAPPESEFVGEKWPPLSPPSDPLEPPLGFSPPQIEAPDDGQICLSDQGERIIRSGVSKLDQNADGSLRLPDASNSGREVQLSSERIEDLLNLRRREGEGVNLLDVDLTVDLDSESGEDAIPKAAIGIPGTDLQLTHEEKEGESVTGIEMKRKF